MINFAAGDAASSKILATISILKEQYVFENFISKN